MDWLNAPIGMIRHDELLNALLALWKTQQSLVSRNETNAFSQGYRAGFEEGLDGIAQIAGLTELFEEGKTAYQLKIKTRLHPKIEVIDSQITYLP
ncbi:MAG: hypothetical protein HC875_05690 [Anaerolineales bacterium]|nr:hypothetical protein [Anaerolineales bacterium]